MRDGDEVSWSTIQSFKSLGIIYTDESGTLGPDDFNPDPSQLEKSELSEQEARELLDIITSQLDPSPEKLAELRDILGISGLAPILDDITTVLANHLEEVIQRNELPVQLERENHDSVETSFDITTEWQDAEAHELVNLKISLLTALSSSAPPRRECGHLMPGSADLGCSSV